MPQVVFHSLGSDKEAVCRLAVSDTCGYDLRDLEFLRREEVGRGAPCWGALYRGREDLVLLHIDPTRLDSPIRWELGVATDPESMLFPHLYGPLPLRAVMSVTPYRPGSDGSFAPMS